MRPAKTERGRSKQKCKSEVCKNTDKLSDGEDEIEGTKLYMKLS